MNTQRSGLNLMRNDEGASAILVAVMIVVLLGVGALTVDAGALYAERRQMQTAADAAALAGVQELPGNPAAAQTVASQYAQQNTSAASDSTFQVQTTYVTNDTITARLQDPDFGLFLARFLGQDSTTVGAQAKAAVVSPSAYGSSVMPFGIMSKEPSGTAPFGYEVNELVRLKQPGGEGESGNFQFLALVDPPPPDGNDSHIGASEIRSALANGGMPYPVFITYNLSGGADTNAWFYNTRTGLNGTQITNALGSWIGGDPHAFLDVVRVNADGTATILDEDCHRIIVCPVIGAKEDPDDPASPLVFSWEVIPGTKPIEIIGFAYFYIEAMGKSGNDCWIDGRFIRPVGPDDDVLHWGGIDPFGSISYRLID